MCHIGRFRAIFKCAINQMKKLLTFKPSCAAVAEVEKITYIYQEHCLKSLPPKSAECEQCTRDFCCIIIFDKPDMGEEIIHLLIRHGGELEQQIFQSFFCRRGSEGDF